MYSSLSNKQAVLIFWNTPTCMVLLHPARLLFFGNFQANLIFLLLIFEKLQPAWHYYILHVYWFWEIIQSAWLLHPARLLDRLEYTQDRPAHAIRLPTGSACTLDPPAHKKRQAYRTAACASRSIDNFQSKTSRKLSKNAFRFFILM